MEPKYLDFGAALSCMRGGARVKREAWSGRGILWIAVRYPDAEHSFFTMPTIYVMTAAENVEPWTGGHTDLLATDWIMVPADNA